MVLVAVPVTLALTLAASYFFGYTLNRVTLFALIFSIGILVDDAIVVVENIHRHYELGWGQRRARRRSTPSTRSATRRSSRRSPSSRALLPLAFVSGLMGPYMRPIPINASAAMIFSLFVAFVVSPWLTYRLLPQVTPRSTPAAGFEGHAETPDGGQAPPLLPAALRAAAPSPAQSWALAGGVVGPPPPLDVPRLLQAPKVKMLPYDNKSEIQVVVDMPEGTTLEATNSVARDLASRCASSPRSPTCRSTSARPPRSTSTASCGTTSCAPGPLVADLQVNLLPQGPAQAGQPHDSPRTCGRSSCRSPSATARTSRSPRSRPGRPSSPRWSPRSTAPTWRSGSASPAR